MKKVIDGKVYDSETATHIDNWDNGYTRGDFHWCDEDLYVTKKGTFFLYGQGGPLSSWAVSSGNERTGGKDIRVLSKGEALSWCETHNVDIGTISKFFDIEEG